MLARKYFDLPESIPVTTYDGRAFLNVSREQYDVIMVDAYQDITIPFQMSSVEFFELVRSHLAPGGVMVVNMNMRTDGPDGINAYLADTISAVFPYVQTADVPYTTNRELFAAETDVFAAFSEKTERVTQDDLRALLGRVQDALTPYTSGGRLLTDDRAPVEKLGISAIDALIMDELSYYKDILRERGISGLIAEVAP